MVIKLAVSVHYNLLIMLKNQHRWWGKTLQIYLWGEYDALKATVIQIETPDAVQQWCLSTVQLLLPTVTKIQVLNQP